jgi:hypothetical protein
MSALKSHSPLAWLEVSQNDAPGQSMPESPVQDELTQELSIFHAPVISPPHGDVCSQVPPPALLVVCALHPPSAITIAAHAHRTT